MLKDRLTADLITLQADCSDWRSAVRESAAMLLRRDFITADYIDAIIANHEEMGAYMVIAPGIMLAHARPENGSRCNAVSLLTLKKPLHFGSELNDPVRLVITLATADATSHMEMLQDLMGFLSDADVVEQVMQADNTADVMNLIADVKFEEE